MWHYVVMSKDFYGAASNTQMQSLTYCTLKSERQLAALVIGSGSSQSRPFVWSAFGYVGHSESTFASHGMHLSRHYT